MCPEASSGNSAFSTHCRSEDLLPAAQTGTWRLQERHHHHPENFLLPGGYHLGSFTLLHELPSFWSPLIATGSLCSISVRTRNRELEKWVGKGTAL